jgi:hypothetical protein
MRGRDKLPEEIGRTVEGCEGNELAKLCKV